MTERLHCQGGLAQGGGDCGPLQCATSWCEQQQAFFPHEARVQIVRTQKLCFFPPPPSLSGVKSQPAAEVKFFPSAFHRGFLLSDGSDSSAFSHQLLFLALPQCMHLSSDPSCTITNKSLNPALIAGAWICGGLFKIMALDEVWLGFFFPLPYHRVREERGEKPMKGFFLLQLPEW